MEPFVRLTDPRGGGEVVLRVDRIVALVRDFNRLATLIDFDGERMVEVVETPAEVLDRIVEAAEPHHEPSNEGFGALVQSCGGGHVDLLVDRDVESYPPAGTKVWVTER